MANRPGGALAARPLHFILIADCSGSMSVEGKIQALNHAIHEALPDMRAVSGENPSARVLMRAVRFSDGARWHVADPQPVESFEWPDLGADMAGTDMGAGLRLVTEQLRMPPMSDRALPPVLVLLSDGWPTDDWETALEGLLAERWGRKAVRIAIAIGNGADNDILKRFVDNPEIPVLQANNAPQLTKHIRWVSTAVLKSASQPASSPMDEEVPKGNVPIPQPLPDDDPDAEDVW